MVFYIDWLVPKPYAGYTRGFLIFIKQRYKYDAGLFEHERTHVKQWLRTLGLHSLFYLLSEDYRYKAEVEAFRKQLEAYELMGYSTLKMIEARNTLAWFFYSNYHVNRSLEEIKLALSGDYESS